MTWWTENGHITMPKAVMAMLAKAAISLRDEIVQEIQEKNSDLHPELGDPWARDVPPGEGK